MTRYPRMMPLGFCMVWVNNEKEEDFYWRVNLWAMGILGAVMLGCIVEVAWLAIVLMTRTTT